MRSRPEREDFGTLEPERYELGEPPSYRFEMDRREFVSALGVGILVSIWGRPAPAQERSRGRRREGRGREKVAERVHVGADGVITVLTGKVEVGQGSRTQISMAAAEELRVPLGSVRLVMADSALVPDDGGTYGSRTTPATIPRVRRACAAAREILVEGAAGRWNVGRSKLAVSEGKVIGPSPEHVLSFADIVRQGFEKGFDREVSPDVTVSKVSEWKVLGTSVRRVDAREIVTGAHRYPSDVVRPGMLHGVVLRPPSYGAKLEAVDIPDPEKRAGVTAVRDGDFVGFAARTSSRAREVMEAVRRSARWQESRDPRPSSDELYAYLKEHVRSGDAGRRRRRGRARERGSVEDGFAAASRVLRGTYRIAYIQHAPMEPRAAVAEWKDGKLTVWTGTQNPGRVRGQLAEAFRLASERVRVIVPDTGGGFGGKHTGEVAIEAARLSREAGKPVSVRWTREEEFTWAYFRPAGLIEIAGGLDAGGSIVAWEHTNYNSGTSAIATPYEVPNTRTAFRYCESPLRQGAYRALAATANVFARESFMDELADATGADPLEFRLRQLKDERLRAVLESAAERFGWSRRRKASAGSGTRGVGLSCGTEKGSCVAACAEVEALPESGRFRVVEVVQAFECGAVHNPGNLEAQVEGSIIQALGGALREEIRFRDGRVLNARFSRYRVPRFNDVPKIETVLLDRSDLPSVGGGETPLVAVGPAVGNALFAAVGERIRSLPLRSAAYRSL